jgi:hypothetical protein
LRHSMPTTDASRAGQRSHAVATNSTTRSIARATVISLMWVRSNAQIAVTAAMPSIAARYPARLLCRTLANMLYFRC